MIFIRRRPIAKAAVIGGVAHAGAKAGAESAAAEAEQQQQDAPPPAPAESGIAPDQMEQLKQLAALHDQGVLTDEEFAAQKAKILG